MSATLIINCDSALKAKYAVQLNGLWVIFKFLKSKYWVVYNKYLVGFISIYHNNKLIILCIATSSNSTSSTDK